jgi:molybdopterin-guanine dinucleotide biosynthesis protein A
MRPRTLGVIVAGGRGVRLGLGRPKAFAEVGGMTLLARAEDVLSALCDEIVIAAPASLELPAHRSARVADATDDAVPLAGLVAGLAARLFDRALALGVDFPRMRPGMLAALLARLGARAAVIPAPGGVPQPLAAAYAPGAAAPLAASLARGERAVTVAALALDPLIVGDGELERLDGGSACFFNLNTPDDLAEAGRGIGARGVERAPEGPGRSGRRIAPAASGARRPS